MSTIAIISGKGGSGKTTTTVGLADHWARAGRSVMVADTDPQEAGGAVWWLDAAEPEQIDWASASGSEVKRQAGAVGVDRLIVDTPPRLDGIDLPAVLAVTDLAVVVAQPSRADIAAAAQTVATHLQGDDSPPYMMLLTSVDPRSLNEAHQARAELLALGHPVAAATIRAYAGVRRAAGASMPSELRGREGDQHRLDVAALAAEIDRLIGD